MSMRPKRATVFSISALQSSSTDTSHLTHSTSFPTSGAIASIFSSDLAAITTFAP